MPGDRRRALAAGERLPSRLTGASLFADISGFTALTEALANELGSQRASEVLTGHLNRAAQHFLRVEHRLLTTLWHLAAMWGRVTPRGTLVPFRLTHEMLAGIIGAQRPATTMGIRSLTEQGRLLRDDKRRYVLLGDPPDWSKEAAPVRSVEV
jgi:hypothetical protein